MTKVLKFFSDTNLGLFVESLDLRMPGGDYEVDYVASTVTLRNPPQRVLDVAHDYGAEEVREDR